MDDIDYPLIATRDLGGDGRTLEGIAVPWNSTVNGNTAEFGSVKESFAPGSFDAAIAEVNAGRRIPITDGHNGPIVGYADHLENRPEGLWFSGRAIDNTAARDFLPAVVEKVVHASVDFLIGTVQRGRGTVQHTAVKRLAAIAGVPAAAYSGTFVAARQLEGSRVAEETLPEAPAVTGTVVTGITAEQAGKIAQAITDDAIRALAARAEFGGSAVVDPFADWRGLTLGEMAHRAMNTDERKYALWPQLASRALDDLVTTAGANAGAVTPGVFGDVHGIVNLGRPSITAFGGPRPIPDASGMTLDWPYFDGTLTDFVGAQSAEKAAITSGTLDIKKGSEALATYAGGADISYQLLRRANTSYLDIWTRVMLAAWALVTNTAFVTELESGSVTSDFAEALASVDATEFKNLAIDASVAVQVATGQPAEFILASTTAYKQFAKLFTPVTTLFNTGLGTTNIRTLDVAVGNLPLIHEPALTAGKLIVSNRLAAAWFEDGPFQAQAEDVEKLGRNVAIWSMGAGARFIPAGIIEMYDVTP